MKTENSDMDNLLRRALRNTESPSDALIQKVKRNMICKSGHTNLGAAKKNSRTQETPRNEVVPKKQ